MNIPPSTAPWSRLELVGEYKLTAPLRVGSMAGQESTERPFIPASTFRGALRSTVEAIARNLDSDFPPQVRHLTISGLGGKPIAQIRRVLLSCAATDKRSNDGEYQGCLTESIVARWQADPLLLPALDQTLAACTCATCRLFGTPWLAGRVRVADLSLIPDSWNGQLISFGHKQQKALPPTCRFRFRVIVDQATFAEQGLILLGLRAIESGAVALGADRARGLGQGKLSIDWWASRYLDAALLIASMRDQSGEAALPFSETDAEARIAALETWLEGLSSSPPSP